MRELFHALTKLSGLRAVVIAGNGKHFSAGLDRTDGGMVVVVRESVMPGRSFALFARRYKYIYIYFHPRRSCAQCRTLAPPLRAGTGRIATLLAGRTPSTRPWSTCRSRLPRYAYFGGGVGVVGWIFVAHGWVCLGLFCCRVDGAERVYDQARPSAVGLLHG